MNKDPNSKKNRTLTDRIARTLSDIFIPPVAALATFIFFSIYLQDDFSTQITMIAVISVFGVVFPVLFFFFRLRQNKIINGDATIKEERSIPYIFTIISLSLGGVLLYFTDVIISLKVLYALYTLHMVVLLIVNYFWKISAHAMGIGVPLGAFFYFFEWWSFPVFILIVIISWARVHLKCHTKSQVIAGSVTGFLITFLLLKLFL